MRNNKNNNNVRKTNTDFEDMLEKHNATKQKRLKNLMNRKRDNELEEDDEFFEDYNDE